MRIYKTLGDLAGFTRIRENLTGIGFLRIGRTLGDLGEDS